MHSRALPLVAMLCFASPVVAQLPQDLARERTEYLTWLRSAPTSPFAAIALQRVGAGLTLGPAGSDVMLSGVAQVRVTESAGRVTLDSGGVSTPLTRNRVMPLGSYRLLAAGAAGRTVLLVFGVPREVRTPVYFPFAPAAIDTVTLRPPQRRQSVLLLAPEGIDVEADEAGSVTVSRFGPPVSLRVRRFPGQSAEEWELEIYFRDATNGRGSYPAGRFVSLQPLGNGRYLLDFNRARNPFCAYSSVFPCPAPWPGNTLTEPVAAGERYGPAPEGEQ